MLEIIEQNLLNELVQKHSTNNLVVRKRVQAHLISTYTSRFTWLNTPIVDDALYGTKTNRLHLQAGYLEFTYSVTRQLMCFLS